MLHMSEAKVKLISPFGRMQCVHTTCLAWGGPFVLSRL